MGRGFARDVKREGLERAEWRCEGVGPLYGLPEGQRCNADLRRSVEFDHTVLWANSRDSSIHNLSCLCPSCHKVKTTKHDTPKAAKTVRQRDKNDGITTSRNPLPGGRKSPWKKTFSGKVVAR